MDNMKIVIFGLIYSSGTARSLVFEALSKAKEGKFEESLSKMEEAKKQLGDAHKIQTSLIQNESSDNKAEVLVHAQDHLMTSMRAKDLISQMIFLEERIKQLEAKVNSILYIR